jgi:hypothetical protein
VGRSYISNRKRVSFANVDVDAMLTKERKGWEIRDDVTLSSVRIARLMLGCGGGDCEFIR